VEANPLILLVRLAGFEPTTPWFVAKYSIQLSYSRIQKPRVYIEKQVVFPVGKALVQNPFLRTIEPHELGNKIIT
jgi:transcription elongation factor GreB